MREDSPRWEQSNRSASALEQDGLRQLADYLPDREPYHVWANVEFVGTDGSINEVDALVLAPRGLLVLELKHWQGEIRGDGIQWVRRLPNSRLIPEDNPYILANRKAKRLASLIKYYAKAQHRDAEAPFVGAAVFLHARGMTADLDPIGRHHIYGLEGFQSVSTLPSLKKFLWSPPANPRHLVDAERARQIVELVRAAKIRPSVAHRKINQLLLHPRPFAEGNGWQDFLAGHTLHTSLVRRVRFYLTSRAPEDEIPAIRKAAEREFRLLQGIHHAGIAGALDLADHPWGPAVIFEHDPDAVRLDQWLAEHNDTLNIAQRLQLVQDIVETVHYAHSRRLAHRALHPRAIFVRDPNGSRPTLLISDWQSGGRLSGLTNVTMLGSSTDPASLDLFFGDEMRRYQAPEAANGGRRPGVQLDVFSLGALTYRIFANADPAESPEQLAAAVRDSGLNLAAAADGMPHSLVTMVYEATRGDPAHRTPSVAKFRADLETVWDEITAPEAAPTVDPLQARKGDVLDGGLIVKERLGTGATATALLVTQATADGQRDLVLKVARDEQHEERFIDEARTLKKLQHWQIAALVDGPVKVGNRTALLLEKAGDRTLADDLQGGRLAFEVLHRYGRDLVEIAAVLDSHGVWHRDIKPANLAARPRPKDKQPHLCIFDFSLATTPADNLTAGTRHYLDPFLGPPRRMRFDAAAERFAVAVTLYEMATGALPQWGQDAYPAAVSDEVTLDAANFEPSIADRLVAFFGRALARDVGDRFATLDDMADAWRAVFRDVPEKGDVAYAELTRDSPLEATDLTVRAVSALTRLGVHTVGELIDYEPSRLTRARGIPDATRKEILAHARALRVRLEPPTNCDGQAEDTFVSALSVETLCAGLLPAEDSRGSKARAAIQVLLGQATGSGGAYLRWPSQTDVARATGMNQPAISTLLRKQLPVWVASGPLSEVRDEIVALLDARGSVMTSRELAESLLASRGSYTLEPRRLPQAIGLVRAAVEAELTRGGDARVAMQRLRNCDTILVGREPDDPASLTTAWHRLDYVVRLGNRAIELAAAEVPPTRQRAVDELRAVPVPDGMPLVSDQRLLQLAAGGSHDKVDVNAQGQLYPVGLPAERALKLALGSLVGQLSVEDVQGRVRARFPRAEALPGRPDLTELLAACEAKLTWHPEQEKYGPRGVSSSLTGTRMATYYAPMLRPDAVSGADARLADTIDRRGVLVLMAPLRRLAAARQAVLRRLPVTEVDVTAILLRELRVLGFPWEAIVAADSGDPADIDYRSLVEMVQHHVVPAVYAAIAEAQRAVLITEAAPLARYGQVRLFQELSDPTWPRPAARLLLVPARRPEPAMLDEWQLPLTPSSKALWLPDTWISSVPAA